MTTFKILIYFALFDSDKKGTVCIQKEKGLGEENAISHNDGLPPVPGWLPPFCAHTDY
jgi:hypothetical protein